MITVQKPIPADAVCPGCHGNKLSWIDEKDGFDIWRCADCKTARVDRYPSDAELMAYYQSHEKTECYLGKKESKLRRSLRRVKRMMKFNPPGKKFLDVGCNIGSTTAAAHMAGLEAFGIDIDASAIANALKNFPGQGRFEHISIQDLAARGDTFDMIYLSEVIEHVRDPDGFIESIAKVMNPGAILYLTAPDGGHIAVPRKFSDWGMVCPPQHLSFFSRKGIRKLLARHGLVSENFQLAFKPGLKVVARKASSR